MNALWPDGHPFAVALSHDVDRVAKRWQFAYYLARAIARRQPRQLWRQIQSLGALLRGDDPYWNFERIMTLEDELGVRSTFFFLNERGAASLFRPRSLMLFGGRHSLHDVRIQQVIHELHSGGWEVALHGSYDSYRDPSLLRREKEQLEAILGEPVNGIRQHYLNLDIPDTWHRQASVGFVYDSTLGFSDQVEFRWGMPHPFYPKDPLTGEEIPLLQIPLGIMDVPLMQMRDPWEAAWPLIDLVEEEQGVLTLNWHQRVFNPWGFQEHQEMYVRIVRECQKREAWVVPLGAIADWWKRHTLLAAPRLGASGGKRVKLET